MSEVKQFKLPDVGEGLTEADIVAWHVKPGDQVTINQVIVEIETAKAVVELPSPYEGVVTGLLVDEGTTVDVGTPIIAVDVGGPATAPDSAGVTDAAAAGTSATGTSATGTSATGAGATTAPAAGAPGIPTADLPTPAISPPAGAESPLQVAFEPGIHGSPAPKVERQAVLVGYGVKLGTTKRRQRKTGGARSRPGGGPAGAAGAVAPPVAPAASPAAPTPSTATPAGPPSAVAPTSPAAPTSTATPAAATAGPASTPTSTSSLAPTAGAGAPPAAAGNGMRPAAKPPVRKLAKDLGVDLAGVAGTGPGGIITREDVQAAVSGAAAAPGPFAPLAPPPPGWEERIAVRGVRKHTAAAVTASAFTAPHVTEFLQVDVTATMEAVRRLRDLPDFAELRPSPLLMVARALLVAVARHPMINSSWDEGAQEVVIKHYVNLGIAAATGRGLIVPNIKDAHAMSLAGLASALVQLTATAREGKAQPADLTGGTITITNVGVFGVDAGTPILTPGEAAILAFGQVRPTPWVYEGELAVRQVSTLSLSFDHRVVDGDLGSAVLRDVGAMLTDPVRMLAWG